MWFSSWGCFKGLRGASLRPTDDRADMGVEIGLDASLDSMLPPLLSFAVEASKPGAVSGAVMPLGTDQRASYRAG